MSGLVDVLALASACAPGVAPETMVAIVAHESANRPYVINVNGAVRLSRQPRTQAEAVATATRLRELGYNFDSGLGQLNSANIERFGVSWTEVFDPCTNLRLSARVLEECYGRAKSGAASDQAALAKALSCYNTGNFGGGLRNGYVYRVYGVAARQQAGKTTTK